MDERFSTGNLTNKVYIHKYSRLREILIGKLLTVIIDFGPFLATLFWTFLYLKLGNFDDLLFVSVLFILIISSFYFTYIFFLKYYLIKVNDYSIELKKIKNPISFVFISDLHISKERAGSNRRRTKLLVKKINKLNPELVIFGGDFVGKKYDMDLLIELKNLNAKYKFGVYGNHDSMYLEENQQSKFPTEGIKRLESLGIEFLNNEGKQINLNGEDIYLGGITDLFSLNFNIYKAFEKAPCDIPRFLVSHNPEIIDFIKNEDQVDLVLSGHTHSGQILLPILGPILPMPVRNKKLTRGIFNLKNTKLFISQGSGYSGTRIRIGTECEICLMNIY